MSALLPCTILVPCVVPATQSPWPLGIAAINIEHNVGHLDVSRRGFTTKLSHSNVMVDTVHD